MDLEINEIAFREIEELDCIKISDAFAQQNWNKPVSQFLKYWEYQKNGERDIIVAEMEGNILGYLTINWMSDYEPFRLQQIPEVVDFNVFKKYQRLGIGRGLMDEAERRIKAVSQIAGIGFGVYSDYGAAQILYINRGYVPDGRGLVKNSKSIKPGSTITLDDSLVMFLIKKLN